MVRIPRLHKESSVFSVGGIAAQLRVLADRIALVVSDASTASSVEVTPGFISAVTSRLRITDPEGTSTVVEGGRIRAASLTLGMLAGAVTGAISDATKTATNYITADTTGIRIANASPATATTYQHQTATEIEFVVNSNSVSSFGKTARIGRLSQGHAIVSEDGFDYLQGDNSVFAVEPYGDEVYEIGTEYGDRKTIADGATVTVSCSFNRLSDEVSETPHVMYRSGTGPWLMAAQGASSAPVYIMGVQSSYDPDSGTEHFTASVVNASGGSITAVFAERFDRRSVRTRIGKAYVSGATDNESHMELDYHSLQLVDKEGESYFHVSDLRGSSGSISVEDVYTGDGSTTKYYYSKQADNPFHAYEGVHITVSDSSVNRWSIHETYVDFATPPSDGSTITITYTSTNQDNKAFTFGERVNGSNVGALSVAEGSEVTASGRYSHVEGVGSSSLGYASHSEGWQSTATGTAVAAHAEGARTTASGFASHAQNYYATAMGSYSSAGGFYTKATGTASHAEGSDSIASGYGAHAEGAATEASGNDSHAQNSHTIAASDSQTAIGRYNDNDPSHAFEIGNGTADDARSNAFAVGWDGTVETAKPIPKASGGTGQTGISTSTVTLSGCTASGQRCWHNGVCCSITMIDVKLSAALANGGSVAFGTIPSGYRPLQTIYNVASSSNATFCGRLVFNIYANGQLGIVNRSGSSLPANTPFSLFVTYAI